MKEEFQQPVSFEASREAFRQLTRGFKPTTYQQFRDLVIRHAVWMIRNMPDVDFDRLLGIGWAVRLLAPCHDLVRNHCDQLQPGQLGEFSVTDFANALVFNLVYWFQEVAHPGRSRGWSMDYGVIIEGAIKDQIKVNMEAERQREFRDRLGPITTPGTVVTQFPDPTKELHDMPALTPETKVNVLKNFMDHQNAMGLEASDGSAHHEFLKYHRRSLEAARRLFTVNPELTAGHLIQVMDCAIELLGSRLPSASEEDTSKLLRGCNDLSFLLLMLQPIVRKHGFDIPVERYLTKKELFGPSINPPASPGGDDPDRLASDLVES